jgi:N-acetylglucosaminyl-diphospho-decaprenol L-rhamnosyltransferase
VQVSAIIVTWNSEADIARCVEALLQQRDVELEIIVVDNASSDGTLVVLNAYAGQVQILPQARNLGYAEGNNVAAQFASGRHLLFVNPDCAPDPLCAWELLTHLQTSPGCGVAAAALRNDDDTAQSFARRDATPGTALWAFVETLRLVDQRWLAGRHAAKRRYADCVYGPGTVTEVDCPAAACVMLHRELFADGQFDTSLPLFFNDADLYRRLRRASYSCQIVGDATARHSYGTSVRLVEPGPRRAEMIAALVRYASRWWPLPAVWLLWGLLVCDSFASLLRPSTRRLARGTLGGLGLPGGDAPWLSVRPGWGGRLRIGWWRLKGTPRSVLGLTARRARRRVFVLRARTEAWYRGCNLVLRVDQHAEVARGIRFEFAAGTRAVLVIGRGARLDRGVWLRLRGDCHISSGCHLRSNVTLNVKGSLLLGDRVQIVHGSTIHADSAMTFGFGATTAEYVTVLDSHHAMDGSLLHVNDFPVTRTRTSVGPCSLLGAHSTVLAGVKIGGGCIVGANSAVTRDLPDGAVAVGVPARLIRMQPAVPGSGAYH